MKTNILLIASFLFGLLCKGQQHLQSVNALLHDESYSYFFCSLPNNQTNEHMRLQAHLYYTEQLLREKPVSHLSGKQAYNRALVLDLLNQYTGEAAFPVNLDHPGERRPCFIDVFGNICAVGYLIEQTKGREMAEAINRKHQYDFLLDMNEPAIAAWADEYGLTLEECAMIQPTYGPVQPQTIHKDIKPAYGIASGVLGGGNIAFTAANFLKHGKPLAYI